MGSKSSEVCLEGVDQTGLLDLVVTGHHLQKDVLEVAVAYGPLEVSLLLFFQLPQALEDHRNPAFCDLQLDQSSDFLNDDSRRKYLQQVVSQLCLDIKLPSQ
jgi:hypothetical protein